MNLDALTILFELLRSSSNLEEQLAVIDILQLLAYCEENREPLLKSDSLQVLLAQLDVPDLQRAGLCFFLQV